MPFFLRHFSSSLTLRCHRNKTPFFLLLTPFFLLFCMLQYHCNSFVRWAGIYVRHPPPFYVPSTSLLCAFFETPLTATKPIICLCYAKLPENQSNNPFRPLDPSAPSSLSLPSLPSAPSSIPRDVIAPSFVPFPSTCLRPNVLSRVSAFRPAPFLCVSRFPRDLQSPSRPNHPIRPIKAPCPSCFVRPPDACVRP